MSMSPEEIRVVFEKLAVIETSLADIKDLKIEINKNTIFRLVTIGVSVVLITLGGCYYKYSKFEENRTKQARIGNK